jgi:uncharacterized membrane protein YkoI
MLKTLIFLLMVPLSAAVSQSQTNASAPQPKFKLKAARSEYLQQAKVSSRVAADSALNRVPNGRIQEAELEKEHGRLVYSFDLSSPRKPGVEEVLVDAKTGSVVSVTHESPQSEARENAKEPSSH